MVTGGEREGEEQSRASGLTGTNHYVQNKLQRHIIEHEEYCCCLVVLIRRIEASLGTQMNESIQHSL